MRSAGKLNTSAGTAELGGLDEVRLLEGAPRSCLLQRVLKRTFGIVENVVVADGAVVFDSAVAVVAGNALFDNSERSSTAVAQLSSVPMGLAPVQNVPTPPPESRKALAFMARTGRRTECMD